MRKRTVIALMFTGGILNSQLPVYAEPTIETPQELVLRLTSNIEVPVSYRAYMLLQIACRYLDGVSFSELAKQYNSLSKATEVRQAMHFDESTKLRDFACSISLRDKQQGNVVTKIDADHSSTLSSAQREMAVAATRESVKLLNECTDKFAQLNLLFVASCIFRRAGNKVEAVECEALIEHAIQHCESGKSRKVDEINGILSVMDARCHALIPIMLPVYNGMPTSKISNGTLANFGQCEKLKLRALRLADMLPSTEHVRRMAHRNLALWFKELGMKDKAEVEKHKLYKLVGFEDERVLFPQSEGCGHLIWWQQERIEVGVRCGMG